MGYFRSWVTNSTLLARISAYSVAVINYYCTGQSDKNVQAVKCDNQGIWPVERFDTRKTATFLRCITKYIQRSAVFQAPQYMPPLLSILYNR